MDIVNEIISYLSVIYKSKYITKKTIRYQVDSDLYCRKIVNNIKPKRIVLIIRGGGLHFDIHDIPYYCKIFALSCKETKIYIYEKMMPMMSYKEYHDISTCINYIRRENDSNIPLLLVGFSVGGIHILNYLSYGKDEADLYITVCSPVNMNYFFKIINTHPIYSRIQKSMCASYNVKTMSEMYKLYAINEEENMLEWNNLILRLQHNRNTLKKCISIIGSKDCLTTTFTTDITSLPITVLKIHGGYHVSYDCITTAARAIILSEFSNTSTDIVRLLFIENKFLSNF